MRGQTGHVCHVDKTANSTRILATWTRFRAYYSSALRPHHCRHEVRPRSARAAKSNTRAVRTMLKVHSLASPKPPGATRNTQNRPAPRRMASPHPDICFALVAFAPVLRIQRGVFNCSWGAGLFRLRRKEQVRGYRSRARWLIFACA